MHATLPLFESQLPLATREELAAGAWVLRGFALDVAQNLLAEIERVAARSPFRHLVTPGGKTMSVAMTNCGGLGWFSDRRGYRYTAVDPETASRANWRAFMSHNTASEEGCFQASYPSFVWEKTQCIAATPRVHPVRRVPRTGAPEITGNGNDYVAQAAGLISATCSIKA